jgi:hypothetical protein
MKQNPHATRRKYHYIYKTTCKVTGKYYIGMHSTDDLEDGYIGSGKRLWMSIKKHGRENHSCAILEFLPSREELKKREREIVNEGLLNDAKCMNLKVGGDGGWDHISSEIKAKGAISSNRSPNRDTKVAAEKALKTKIERGSLSGWKINITTEFKSAQSKRNLGRKFIHKDGVEKKIYLKDLDMYIQDGWALGRK